MMWWCRWLKRNLVWHTSEATNPHFSTQSRYAKQPQFEPQFKQTNEINIGSKFDQNQCCADADDWKEISFGTHQRLTNPHFSTQSRYAKQPQFEPQFKQTNEINIGSKFDQNQCCADADDWKEISFGTRQRLTNPHFSGRTSTTKDDHTPRIWIYTSHMTYPYVYSIAKLLSERDIHNY